MGMSSQFGSMPKELLCAVVSELFSCSSGCRIRELKCPDSLVKHYKPVSCNIRQWITENAVVLVLVSAVVLSHKYKNPIQIYYLLSEY